MNEYNEIAKIVELDGVVYAVFADEDTAHANICLFPDYKCFACFGGYYNALVLG